MKPPRIASTLLLLFLIGTSAWSRLAQTSISAHAETDSDRPINATPRAASHPRDPDLPGPSSFSAQQHISRSSGKNTLRDPEVLTSNAHSTSSQQISDVRLLSTSVSHPPVDSGAFGGSESATFSDRSPQHTANAGTPNVSVVIRVPSAAEKPPSVATAIFSRASNAPTDDLLVITFLVSGTAATDGSDCLFTSAAPLGYDPANMRGTIVLMPGETFVALQLEPVDDEIFEGTETVTLTIAPDPAYSLGASISATLTIADNDAPDQLAEFFTAEKPFDLAGKRLTLVPLNDGGYRGSLDNANTFTTDPATGTALIKNGVIETAMESGDSDDGYWCVNASASAPNFFGAAYDHLYVSTNGFISFADGDSAPTGSLPTQFLLGQPRLSAYWRDLNPQAGGEISICEITTPGGERCAITWLNIPLYGNPSKRVSMQVELWHNGTVTVTWLASTAQAEAVVGFSPGLGMPASFFETDFSRYATQANQPGITGWRAHKFSQTQLFDLSVSGENADPDGDAMNNLVEYALGGEPLSADSRPATTTTLTTTSDGSFLTLTFTRRIQAADTVITPQFSSDLVHWTSSAVQVGQPINLGNGCESVTYRDTMPATATEGRFGRLYIAAH